MIVSFQDEFGGYCSRLRIDGKPGGKKAHGEQASCQETSVQDDDGAGGPNVDVNLCKLLNIDVDRIALMIAQGQDPWGQDDQHDYDNSKNASSPSKKSRKTCDTSSKKACPLSPNPRTRSSCFAKTDKKKQSSLAASQTKESTHRSELKPQSNCQKTTTDENMATEGPSCHE